MSVSACVVPVVCVNAESTSTIDEDNLDDDDDDDDADARRVFFCLSRLSQHLENNQELQRQRQRQRQQSETLRRRMVREAEVINLSVTACVVPVVCVNAESTSTIDEDNLDDDGR